MLSTCKRSKQGVRKFALKKKSTHTLKYSVKEFVCLSVAKFDLNYLRTGKIEWTEIFLEMTLSKSYIQNFLFLGRGLVWPGQRAKKPTFLPSISYICHGIELKIFTSIKYINMSPVKTVLSRNKDRNISLVKQSAL